MTKEQNSPISDLAPGLTLVFVRHGHRDKPVPEADNGLSDKGVEQVDDLVSDYELAHMPESSHFWSSPKLRCTETLGPLAEAAGEKLVVEKLLDEQGPDESKKDFSARIEALLKKAIAVGDTVYMCSHGDFIPEAIDSLAGKHVDVSKGEAVFITQNENGKWELG